MRGAVDQGGDAGVLGGGDDGPGDGPAAVEVVQGGCAERGGAHWMGGARVRGEVEVGFLLLLVEGVVAALEEGQVWVAEFECGAQGGGRWGREGGC